MRANYAYDAWGKVLSVTDANGNEITDPNHMGRINPIRYRGYYYDEETGFYYLNSRYYDPVTGRFLNADTNFYGRTGIAVANIFSYCDNNPINRTDPTGEIAIADDIIVFGVIALLMVCAAYTTTPDFQASWNSVCTGISDTISSIAGGFTYTKKSGKESSSQHPSWVNKGMIDYGLSADENASRIMNQQYGPGNWKKGPKSEFNQIKKWLVRHEGVRQVVPSSSNPVRQVEKPKPSQSSSSSLKPGQFMGGSGNGHYIDMGGSGKMWVPD